MNEQAKRVLIVDDDNELSAMYTQHLVNKGFVTQRVDNGENALSSALEFKPNIILLDVMMPKINGFDVLDILKNTDSTKQIPVIMLTALNSNDDKVKAQKLGANAYLEKSITDLDSITDKINEFAR